MAYLSSNIAKKKRQNFCRQSRTFNDEPQICLFLKVVMDAIKMSMTLFFAFFLMSTVPRNHPQPKDLRPFPPLDEVEGKKMMWRKLTVLLFPYLSQESIIL